MAGKKVKSWTWSIIWGTPPPSRAGRVPLSFPSRQLRGRRARRSWSTSSDGNTLHASQLSASQFIVLQVQCPDGILSSSPFCYKKLEMSNSGLVLWLGGGCYTLTGVHAPNTHSPTSRAPFLWRKPQLCYSGRSVHGQATDPCLPEQQVLLWH